MSRMRIDDHDIANADVFRNLLDNFPDMIHSIDDSGDIVYANKTAEELLGYSHDELLSMSIWQIYADEIMEDVKAGFKNLKQKGEVRVESILKNKAGKRIPVEIRSFSIYDNDGEFIRTFSILRDMQPIKELQNSLVHAGRLAAIGELSAGVAHDINNPLTVVVIAAEMIRLALKEESADLEKMRSQVEDIKKAAGSIQKLSSHLRNFSRGVREKYEALDIYAVIEDSIFITSNKLHVCTVELKNTVPLGRHFTIGSTNQLEQVFVNLISNACDAMAERDERILSIQVSEVLSEQRSYWACEISDTGAGISSDLIDNIFQSFFTTKPKGTGTGLGLSIARGIIKEHGGDIQVSSTPGQGTLFSVLLPQIDPPLESDIPA